MNLEGVGRSGAFIQVVRVEVPDGSDSEKVCAVGGSVLSY